MGRKQGSSAQDVAVVTVTVTEETKPTDEANVIDWSKYPNFGAEEFRCKHTNKEGMQEEFVARLQKFRTAWGRPMAVTSGYRHPTHPIEARKANPGRHSNGDACDIAVTPDLAYAFVKLAMEHGFTGIGVSQRDGKPRFVHLDTRESPRIWGY